MQAILLVGGKGTRLRPLTISTPKPMLPVAGVPFTAHQIARARDAGVTRIVLGTSYKPDVFSRYFGDGSDMGVELVYRTEEEPLGTGGGIRFAAEALTCGPDEPVLVFNGDVLSGVDLRRLVATHEQTAAAVTLHLTRVPDPRAFGLVPTDAAGRVTGFLEKPTTEAEIVTDQINAGCYVFRREIIDRIPSGSVVSVERQTFPELLAAGERLTGVVDDSYWLDLGTPLSFARGSADLVLGRVDSSAVPGPTGEFLVLPGAVVDPAAELLGGTVVGSGAVVAAGARIEGSVLMSGATVEQGATVSGSVLADGVRVGERASLTGVVAAEDVTIGADVELVTGARVWPGAALADGSVRFSSDR